jgi:hypothetical protein|tara:strand:- start:157 stop:477 length:321 start_codon:yes stop_codon:yes gene_type:complete
MSNYKDHIRGEVSKNLIINHLILAGYEVLNEGSAQGLIDLVAVENKTGATYFIDCKCLSRRANGSRVDRVLKQGQKDLAEKSGLPFILAYADAQTNKVEIPKLGIK